VIDINTGKIEFVEALVRIVNGEGRLIPAGVFIDLVYELGLISELDGIVLELIKEKQEIISRIEKDILKILKIDGTLIKDLDKHKNIQKIVYIISILCESLNLKAVAEFVENKRSLDTLKDMGIHYAQGFYISKPKTIEELIVDVFSEKYKNIF